MSLQQQGVSICVRDTELFTKGWQCKLPMSAQSESYLAREAYKLFLNSYGWKHDIRSITVRAIDLIPADTPTQIDLFNDRTLLDRMESIDAVVDKLRQRFGNKAVQPASLVWLFMQMRIVMPAGFLLMLISVLL